MHRVSRPTFDVSPQQGHFVPQRSTLQITALKLKYYRPKKAKYRLHSTHGGESCEKQRLACNKVLTQLHNLPDNIKNEARK